MFQLRLPSVALGACWVVTVVGVVVMWQLLPTALSQAAVLSLTIVAIILGLKGNILPTVYTCAFVGLALINYTQIQFNIAPVISTLAVFSLITLITWIKNYAHVTSVGRLEALLLAFFVSQTNSIASLWPVSFYNRALVAGLVFYLFWHILERHDENSPSLSGHFVFVAIIAILIVGSIIWANFPQLLSF